MFTARFMKTIVRALLISMLAIPRASPQTNYQGQANIWTAPQIFNAGNLLAAASLPILSNCGTGSPVAAAGSSAYAGQFTTGGGATTACTVTFAAAFPNFAFCVVVGEGVANSGLYVSAQSKTAFTITYASATATSFQYVCNGN